MDNHLVKNSKYLYKILFDIYFVLLFLRATIFVNNSLFNTAFGGFSIIFILFLVFTYENFKIEKKIFISLIVLGIFIFLHLILIILYRHNIIFFIKDLFRYIYLLCIFLLGYYYGRISDNKRVFWVIFFIIMFHVLYGLYNFVTGNGIVELHGNKRLYGYFVAAGKFGTILGFSAIFFFVHYKLEKRIIFLLLFLITIFLLGLNNTLKSVVVLLSSFAFYYIIYKKRFEYLVVLFILGILFIIINPEIYLRVKNILSASYDPDIIYGTHLENSFQWRFLQWYQLINDWWYNYTLFGAGLGQETKLHGYVNSEGIPYIAHSDFVKLLIETGMLGILLLSYSLITLYRKYKLFVKKKDNEILLILFYYFLFGGILGSSLITITISLFLLYIGNLRGSMISENHLKV